MSATNSSPVNINANVLVHEVINDDYEWIQYNNQLRIIRSIKDDTYQMQSIIDACRSNKLAKDWFNNQSTKELLSQFDHEKLSGRILPVAKSYEKRDRLCNGLRSYYVNRLLVNAVAMWASPRYAMYIFILLDRIANDERRSLEQTITKQKPRMVPKNKEKSYKYMIWKEEQPDDPDMILLHLVRRNNRAFSQVISHFNNKDECWFHREKLPIAMTPNEDIKDLVRKTLPESEYDINACTILTYKEHLPRLHDVITEYFDKTLQS